MATNDDLLVVGAGALGLSIGWRCAQRGLTVHVVDRGRPGGGATGASAGMLSPTEPAEWTGALGSFNRRALEAWAGFAAELEEATGAASGYEVRGELRLLRGDSDTPFVEAAAQGAAAFGLPHERLSEEDLHDLEPGIAPGSTALWLPAGASVNTDELVDALVRACELAGARVTAPVEVTSLSDAAGVRAELAGGGSLQAGQAVVCAGAWSGGLMGEHGPPVEPVLGESVLLDSGQGRPCRCVIRSAGGSVAPRRDGTLWVGTTRERAGFVDAPRAGSVRAILANAAEFLPALEGLPFLGARAGLRPASPDGRPIVGPSAVPGVALATGHGRVGIQQAALTAELVAEALSGGSWPGELAAFEPARLER